MSYQTAAKRRRAQKLHNALKAAKRSNEQYRFYEDFREGLITRQISPYDFGIRCLFEQFVEDGRELVEHYNPINRDSINLVEASDMVKTTDFSNLTGQIVYSATLEAFNDPVFLWPELFETIPTQFDGEKIPGIGAIGDQAEAIGEGQPYPIAGLSEQWVETPTTIKRGMIVAVSKEAVFFDRTSLVLTRAAEVGRFIGVNKEKRCLDVALGLTTTYRRNGGSAQATYGDTHTEGDFDNLAASNALVDWTDIETAELLFDAITDPETGEPVDVQPNSLIVPTALKHTARRIVSATEIQHGIHGSTAAATVTVSPKPDQNYKVLSNQYVKNRTSSATTWFLGDPKRAFGYMENWGPVVTQPPDNSHDEFHRDIVNQYKVSERGAAAVLEPRRMVKCTG